MKFPNKVISYKESIIANFPKVLSLLEIREYDVFSLYNDLSKKMSIGDFVNTLDCLFALNKIVLNEGVISYVNKNSKR